METLVQPICIKFSGEIAARIDTKPLESKKRKEELEKSEANISKKWNGF